MTQNQHKPWTYEELAAIKQEIEANGLTWEAIENFDPSHWYDVLLDGPRKAEQMEQLKRTIQAIGRAGIPIMGYNFSIAGVWGWVKGPWGRGGARALVYDESKIDKSTPMPNGMVWNMVYDPKAPPGNVPAATPEQLWSRLERFLNDVLPVAEKAGVRLALHPDDPPMPTIRGQPRLVYQPSLYQKVIDLNPSPANQLEFCVGSLAEMTEGDIYDVIRLAKANSPYGRDQSFLDGSAMVRGIGAIKHRVDRVNMARRSHAPALFSTALHDQTCPPSTVFAARNHYAGEADIEVYAHNQHEGGLMYQWLLQAEFLAARV